MSLPSPLLTLPGISDDQLYFNGVTLGGGNTPFSLVKLEGLGKPKVRSGNTSRPRARGSFVGLNLLDTRTITATLDIGGPGTFGSYVNLAGALAALRTACATEGTTEYPLWIKLPHEPLVACMARVTGFDPPYDVIADLGGLIKAVPLQFEATDPYLYSAPTTNTIVDLPTPGVGFTFPLTFPWGFGGGTSGNQQTITNSGDVPCYPVLVINGPCLNPTVSNESLAGNPTLAFNMQLGIGDQLVIDCDLQAVTFYPAGSTVGSPAPDRLDPGATFFTIVPGANIIAFNSQDTSPASGTLNVWAASAYDGLL